MRRRTLFLFRLIGLVVLVSGCGQFFSGPPVPTVPPSPTVSLTLPPTPVPDPALSPNEIWVGIEGLAAVVASVTPDGALTLLELPLNEGQQASDVIASQDGSTLAYLVWNADATQRGIATWTLVEANARLIGQALPGYRITNLYLTDDGHSLAYVLVEEGQPLESADWRVETITITGGEPVLVIGRGDYEDLYPPTLFAWPARGDLYMSFATPDGTSQGVKAVDPDTSETDDLLPLDDPEVPQDDHVSGPALSPNGLYLAYLTYDAEAPGAPDDSVPSNVVRVVELDSGAFWSMEPAENHAIYGLRWLSDSETLLFDIVHLPDEEEGDLEQLWAVAEIGQDLPWSQKMIGDVGDRLFDYLPYGEGVAYTDLPETAEWNLYILTEVSEEGGLLTLPLPDISQEVGALTVIHAPQDFRGPQVTDD